MTILLITAFLALAWTGALYYYIRTMVKPVEVAEKLMYVRLSR